MRPELGIPGLEALERLDSNGFVTSYRAWDVARAERVAVDVLPSTTGDEEALKQFRRMLLTLNVTPRHPAILFIRSLGRLGDGRPYVIAARATDHNLAARARAAPLPSTEVVLIGAALADGLAAAHERGIVHGDVRLDNVWLTEQGYPVLGGFGYARLARTLRTARNDLVTSLTNASPEVTSGAELDDAADVWALCCCLQQMLLGQSSFGIDGGATLSEIVEQVGRQPLEDLRAAGIPEDLAAVLEAGLDRHRPSRLATAASLRDALDGVSARHRSLAAEQPLTTGDTAPDTVGFPPDSAPLPDHRTFWGPLAGTGGDGNEPDQQRTRRQLVALLVTAALLLGVLSLAVLSLVRS